MNKNWLFIIVITLSFAFGTPIGYSVQNPSIRNPAGATTIPPSYLSNSLVDTSNPIDTTGNQIVTGNVRRGMHFRGNVPYQSPSNFNSTLGSASLNSFMRDSAGTEDIGSNRGRSTVGSTSGTHYQPYNLPSASVTTMSQNRPGVSNQLNTRTNNNQYVSGSQTQQNQPAISSSGTSTQPKTLWQLYNPGLAGTQNQYNTPGDTQSISASPRQVQQDTNQNRWNNPQISENQTQTPPRYSTSEPVPATTTNQHVPATTQQLTPVQNGYEIPMGDQLVPTGGQNIAAPYQSGNLQQSSPTSNNTAYQPYTGQQPMSRQQYQGQGNRIPNAAQDTRTSEAIAQIQKQLDDLILSIDSRLQNPTDHTSQYTTTVQPPSGGMTNLPIGQSNPRLASGIAQPKTDLSYQPGQTNQDFSAQTSGSRLQNIMKNPDSSVTRSSQNQISSLPEFNQLSQAEVSARARQIMGPHTDVESFSQAKYTQLYRAAEGHLNIGRFRQAADAFSLAAIYNPDEPQCHAGRGHALFAAGEYISSALFLIRAIEIDPEYVNRNIDLVELLGDAEDLNNKIAELNKWLQKSNAPGLGFLLGYVYYHTGRLNEARQVMEVVMQEMPQSRATVALKMAVDFKLKSQ